MMAFRYCCNTWKWCDGDCKKCSVTQTTYTTSSGTKKRKFELRDNKSRLSPPNTFVTPDKTQDYGEVSINPDDVVGIIISKHRLF